VTVYICAKFHVNLTCSFEKPETSKRTDRQADGRTEDYKSQEKRYLTGKSEYLSRAILATFKPNVSAS